jgi:signal transduction histidine kinase
VVTARRSSRGVDFVLTLNQITRLPVGDRSSASPSETTGAIPLSELDLRVSRLGRGERLITWGRVASSAISLAAVWVDPPGEPARLALVASSLLLAYLVYSVILALVLSSVSAPLPRVGVGTHLLDLGVALAVDALTGVGSPFFVLFVFLLVAAALRWQWRGIMMTGSAIVVGYLVLGLVGLQTVPDSELDRVLIRAAYLAVVAMLLGFLGTWEGQLRRGLVELADVPRKRHGKFEEAARDSLAHAAAILRAPRVLLAWEDTEEPWLDTLMWRDGELARERHDPGTMSPLAAESLRDAAFFCLDLTVEEPTTVRTTEKGLRSWRGQPLHAELVRRYQPRNVLSVPIIGEGVTARLFAFDKPHLTSDDLVVGLIVGRQIVGVLEQHFLVVETRQSAANQERIRVARELHDGIAQSLAAATFHIRGLRKAVVTDPETARAGLDEIEKLLVNEQRELRLFMQELRPWTSTSDDGSVRGRLQELCHRVSSLWGVEVELEESDEIGQPMAWEVYRLAQEGLINAARHAQATLIRVAASRSGNRVTIRVADNGHGFPFEGVYDLATLEEKKIGPVSLKERVASLRGDLLLSTNSSGTTLEITLPHAQGGEAT